MTYQICDILNPTICSVGTHTITRVNSFRAANSSDDSSMNKMNAVLENNLYKGVLIYPNPSTGWFNILFNDFISSTAIEVYNLLGQKVFHENIYNEKEYKLDLSNFSAGTYLLKIINGEESLNKKIIIK